MLEHTKKRRTKKQTFAGFYGDQTGINRLRTYAKQIGLVDASETYSIEEVFPEVAINKSGVVLRGVRHKEEITQRKLAVITGIPQRHISEMEHGKRPIGKDTAKKLAKVFKTDYRMFL